MRFQKLFFSILVVLVIGTDIFIIRQQLKEITTSVTEMDESWKIIYFIKQ